MIGYITPVSGSTELLRDWLLEHGAKYSHEWGWYFDGEAPALPAGLMTSMPIHWEQLQSKMATGEYGGKIGNRFSTIATCSAIYNVSNTNKKCYYFVDDNNRAFVWFTTPREVEINKRYTVTGTVKNHQIFRGEKQTVLNRCIVKECNL